MSNLSSITDSNFENEVLQSSTPVLVDYWAEWCGPCKQLIPILEELAPSYEGKIKIVKLNIESNNSTASKFGVKAIPTMMLFKNGKVVATKVGALSKSKLTEFLDSHL